MKVLVLSQPADVSTQPLRPEVRPLPKPGVGEVLIRVSACGVCRTDLHVVEGDLEVRRSPLVPGHQVVGVVEASGDEATAPWIGARVGVAWLHRTCGQCRFCRTERENLCDEPAFTGWTHDGGFAEYIVAPAEFTYSIPSGFSDVQAAPLLCAGIIGYRCLRQTRLSNWAGARLGIYGFGAAGHVAIQIARARGAEVYVCTRDAEKHRSLAEELGAAWTGGTMERPPVPLDASIIFAPAGEIVPAALSHLDKGGTLVLGGIHMSPIPSFSYDLLYRERVMLSVANNTREDGREFLEEAARIPVHTHVETFRLENANEALNKLKHDSIRGAAVLIP